MQPEPQELLMGWIAAMLLVVQQDYLALRMRVQGEGAPLPKFDNRCDPSGLSAAGVEDSLSPDTRIGARGPAHGRSVYCGHSAKVCVGAHGNWRRGWSLPPFGCRDYNGGDPCTQVPVVL